MFSGHYGVPSYRQCNLFTIEPFSTTRQYLIHKFMSISASGMNAWCTTRRGKCVNVKYLKYEAYEDERRSDGFIEITEWPFNYWICLQIIATARAIVFCDSLNVFPFIVYNRRTKTHPWPVWHTQYWHKVPGNCLSFAEECSQKVSVWSSAWKRPQLNLFFFISVQMVAGSNRNLLHFPFLGNLASFDDPKFMNFMPWYKPWSLSLSRFPLS